MASQKVIGVSSQLTISNFKKRYKIFIVYPNIKSKLFSYVIFKLYVTAKII